MPHTRKVGPERRLPLIARLRSLTVEDAASVLQAAQVSDPLTAEDVFAFYSWMLDGVICGAA